MLEFYVDSLITIHFFNYHGGVIISDLMINGQIRDKEVRLIANDGEQLGVMSAREAQKLADEAGLDLVKISPKAKPPVCKIIDYGKYKYEQTRKEKLSECVDKDGEKFLRRHSFKIWNKINFHTLQSRTDDTVCIGMGQCQRKNGNSDD